ncbi:MAG: molybdopterin synthase sulfur carrier subunit [Promethearchaeota archaeon Loki_b32]|nr:MAG: molybdopterin synthase sulfur carrier subunit [Candidatus Lokiarchaeota archaeon Loki_b32]
MNNNSISVTVKFFATLRQYGPDKDVLIIPENSKVKLLFDKYSIPKEERRAIILVNGRPHKDLNTVIKDGDLISIFPPIGGG